MFGAHIGGLPLEELVTGLAPVAVAMAALVGAGIREVTRRGRDGARSVTGVHR
jgi:hypothetical protein